MVLMRMAVFPALLVSASFIGDHSGQKNAKIDWAKNKELKPARPFFDNPEIQKQIQPLDADKFDPKEPNQTEPTKRANAFFLESHKTAKSKKAETLQSLRQRKLAGPLCSLVVPIDQKPHVDCGLTQNDAVLLAKSAIEGQDFPGRELLMGKIKTPWDILTADRAIAKVLEEANIKATPAQAKANSMRALFLRDNMGQCVINQAIQTWHGKRVLAAYVLKVLPSELNPRIPAVQSLAGDGKLVPQVARQLADSFILKQPLKNRHEKLEQIIGFKDLVVLEEVAIQALAEATQNAKSPEARAELAMNFLFLLHELGTQTANRIMTERADRVAYMRHMVKSLNGG
jgi:hypothetical protein